MKKKEKVKTEVTENMNNIGDYIGFILLCLSFIMFLNSFIWSIADDDMNQYFDRLFLSILCLGFSGIIFKLRK